MLSSRYMVKDAGMSLVEVLVSVALVTLIFGGILSAVKFSLDLLLYTKAQTAALGLANERLEYLRSIPYDQVGTVSGIPSGTIAQNETINRNGETFNRRTLIQYVDSPADGSGGADSNGITADYKRAKVEISWVHKSQNRSVSLITNLIPKGIETVAGGGTLMVNIFNAATVPVSGAAVRVVNASSSPTIDVTAYSDAAGQVIFPGAPAGGGYQLFVSKSGYSSAQTYLSSTTNPNPNPSTVAVAEGDVSTVNFAIDILVPLTILTVEPPSVYTDVDTFADMSGIASSTAVTTSGGSMLLTASSGVYASLGEVRGDALTPSGLVAWDEVRFTGAAPLGTSFTVQVYEMASSGAPTLVPETALPGNAAGFSTSPIDISILSASGYPSLALGAVLTTSDASSTPELYDWQLRYEAANVPIPSIPLTISGSKNIGTDGSGVPVLKYTGNTVTNAVGSTTLSLEWDVYDVAVNGGVTGYDISDVCPRLPVSLSPGIATTTTIILSPHTSNSLRATVSTAGGASIPNASVRVTRGGYDTTETSSSCGSAFFSGMSSATDYVIESSAAGYQTETLPSVTISGATTFSIILTPL